MRKVVYSADASPGLTVRTYSNYSNYKTSEPCKPAGRASSKESGSTLFVTAYEVPLALQGSATDTWPYIVKTLRK